ncbi:MAG: hypothetical protein V9G10_08205 [Candidatus Nanopelagicales bacterium]
MNHISVQMLMPSRPPGGLDRLEADRSALVPTGLPEAGLIGEKRLAVHSLECAAAIGERDIVPIRRHGAHHEVCPQVWEAAEILLCDRIGPGVGVDRGLRAQPGHETQFRQDQQVDRWQVEQGPPRGPRVRAGDS